MNLQEHAKRSLDALLAAHKTVAFAESCTGGLIAKTFTDCSGASAAFECGVVSYSGRIKHEFLGVSEDTLAAYGEVSAQTAQQMARGVALRSGADIGVGVTGIAGPMGGSKEKPVGLIYVCLFDGTSFFPIKLELYDPILSRSDRREKTAQIVFDEIYKILK